MIWLSRTTEVEEEHADEAGQALDEAEELDSRVSEKEGTLASAVEELDRKEKKKEREWFKGEIDSQKEDWFDLITEYSEKKKTMDTAKVFRLDRVVIEVERYHAEEWRYGSGTVPPFKYFAGIEERKRILLGDNDARTAMREILSVIKRLGEARERARNALIEEASRGSTSTPRRGSPEIDPSPEWS
jgi:hypothetical protein